MIWMFHVFFSLCVLVIICLKFSTICVDFNLLNSYDIIFFNFVSQILGSTKIYINNNLNVNWNLYSNCSFMYTCHNFYILLFIFSINWPIPLSSLFINLALSDFVSICNTSISSCFSTNNLSVAIEHSHIWYVLLAVI